MNTRLTPSESFPEDLTSLDLPEVEVLNSKIQRELSHDYVSDGGPDPETEFRSEELSEELDRRDALESTEVTSDLAQSSGSTLGIVRPL
ncbi:hypothetical protein [Arthrobacter agilis]|uniref:hypothetical protein n=1 Tax=Arthrobacter agilis TaxID=37921 RepID=UPI002788528A|nr:hypothetical protein [Arthrobacter agilis]MDQ0734772.1 hypothetical protein [Arthrobacter agilis]